MEENIINKKKNIILILVLILILFGLCGYIIYDKFVNNSKIDNISNEVKKEENDVIDEEVKKELLSLIGLTENGFERVVDLDGQLDKSYEWVEIIPSKVGYYFIGLEEGEYTGNDLSIFSKVNLINVSPITKDRILRIDDDYCEGIGAGYCKVITLDTYKEIAKRYGFNEDPLTVFEFAYQDKYYIVNPYVGYKFHPDIIEDKLSYDVKNNEYYIIYDIKTTPQERNGIISKKINQTITFVFDKNLNLSRFKVVNK